MYSFIERHEGRYPIAVMCAVLEIRASGYYAWRSRPVSERAQADEALKVHIVEVWAANRKAYGSPRVTKSLQAQGQVCGKNRVARLMAESGLKARKKRGFQPAKTDSAHGGPMADCA